MSQPRASPARVPRPARPGEKAGELIRSYDEDGILEPLGAQQLDSTGIPVEPHVVARERCVRKRKAILGGRVRFAVCGPLAHEDHKSLDAEVLARGVGNGDVAEVRRSSGAVKHRHSHSSTSSPTSTASPARAPAALRIFSSSASAGGLPVTRKPLSVRKMR